MSEHTTPDAPLSEGQRVALGLAVMGMLAVGAYGLVISYWTVRELAEKLSMPLPHIFPIGIEGGMIAVLAIDIVLTWIGRPIGWLRQVARALSATAIGINAYAGMEYGPAAVIMHALAPAILIVGVEALRHHLLAVLKAPTEREPIPWGRWLLALPSTIAMRRRMILWQQPKYSEALDTHLDRHEAIAELKRAFGWRWKKHIPAGLAYRLSVGVRLAESTAEVRALLADHYARVDQEHAHTVRLMDAHTPGVHVEEVEAWREPVRVPIGEGVRAVVGGDRVDGYLSPGDRELLPIVCAEYARERARVHAEGAEAIEQLEAWRAREDAARTRTRIHARSAVAAARPARTRPVSARVEQGVRASEGAQKEHTQEEIPGARAKDVDESSRAHTGGAVHAKKRQGAQTRARVREYLETHPGHSAEAIAAHVGVTASTVRRHLSALRTA
ncbi:DUF2637 domain-containing protein [Nocardiopsis alba]|uniref:DUF2637 domain-containing protein n=1 Tax=Nocardiopsis alba TaxID=53437 RepID=A0A7K2IL75_9ACTN|nr:DUF2637 domain-containing protein [Nocardiopsis alba]MYR30711.1 DUF2637 domain-containing protein [Nocardiopsis alba]MYR35737.1 DUF2637 domain-containing protein [Nocardiopsis alba]